MTDEAAPDPAPKKKHYTEVFKDEIERLTQENQRLADEVTMLRTSVSRDTVDAPQSRQMFEASALTASVIPSFSAGSVSGEADSDEWKFIEKSIAEVQIDFTSGSMTGVMKKLFNVLDARVKLWRMARELVNDIGVGATWPQWSALGRDDSTGKRVVKAPPVPSVSHEPAPSRDPNAPGSTPSELAAKAFAKAGQLMPDAKDEMKAIGRAIAAEMRSRPEPVRTPQPAGAPS